jgi:hypothetical protein
MFVWKESSVNTLSATYKNIGFGKQIKSKIQNPNRLYLSHFGSQQFKSENPIVHKN